MRRYPDHPGAISMVTPMLVADARLRELINRMLQPDPSKRPRASQLLPIPDPVPVPVPVPPPNPVPAAAVYAGMSQSELEAAVGDRAAARHAYVDTLQAALPACEAGEKRAVDASDYDEAARFSILEKGIRAILAGIEKPRSKAEIKGALDGGIISQIEQAERALHLEWQRKIDVEKAELGHRVNSVKEEANFKTAQLLDQEKAAAAQKDFARAKQMKEAREASARDGVSAVDKITKELEVSCGTACTLFFLAPVMTRGNRIVLQERMSAIRVREPKPSETRARLQQQAAAILSYVPKIGGQDSKSLFALVKLPPAASGYDLAAIQDSDVDPLKDFMVFDKSHALLQMILPNCPHNSPF